MAMFSSQKLVTESVFVYGTPSTYRAVGTTIPPDSAPLRTTGWVWYTGGRSAVSTLKSADPIDSSSSYKASKAVTEGKSKIVLVTSYFECPGQEYV